MKTEALKNFRQKLADKESVYGLWITLESPGITEIAVASGMDWGLRFSFLRFISD